METILIQATNKKELKLVQSFLDEHKLKGHILSESDKEDIVLGKLMEQTDYNKVVDTDRFLKQLKS
ncbi:MAG: hypothetical protein M3004_05485 [Bacteroidota bacterium]|nr:hypothetical protein [Bacteroidota bacterium]